MKHTRLAAGLLCALLPVVVMANPLRPYAAADWNLAWRAFLGGQDLHAAYALARTAIKARPDSVLWHRRLALVAEQSGHPDTALDAYDWLVMRADLTQYLDKALNLANALNDAQRGAPLMLLALRTRPYSEQRWLATISELLKLGDYPRALRQLRDADQRHPRRFFLWEQAVLYNELSEPGRQLEIFETYRERYGSEPRVMLRIATLKYLRGDIQGAYKALLQARPIAGPEDTAYWRTLSELAYLLEDYRIAGQAIQVLYDRHTANADDYKRLYLIHLHTDAHRAFIVAETGWRLTHDTALFLDMLSAASVIGRPAWLGRAFATLGPGDTERFANNRFYWTGLATWRASQGRIDLAQRAYARVIALNPGDDALWARDLWLLIDAHDRGALAALLPRLAERADTRPALWSPLAAGYVLLGEPQHALKYLDAEWTQRQQNPAWLVNYADTLEQAGQPQLANQQRQIAFARLAATLLTPHNEATIRRKRLLTGLASHLLPGDPAHRWIQRLAQHPQNEQTRVQILAWSLNQSDGALARLWRWRTFIKTPPPAWAQLSLALGENNASTAARLLETRLSALPKRDASTAAESLGWAPLATTLAFQGMRSEPDEPQWRQRFQTLAIPRSDALGANTRFTQANGLRQSGLGLNARHWLAPGIILDARIEQAAQSVDDSGQLGVVPTTARAGSLRLTRTLPRGSASFSLGGGRNVADYARAGADWRHDWNGRLSSTLSAAFGATPKASIPLQIGGLEDRIDLGGRYVLTARDTLEGRLRLGAYRAQGGGRLGSTSAFILDYTHQFRLSPRDYRLTTTFSGSNYTHAAQLPAQLARLVPTSTTPDTSFFIPRSYLQTCIGGGFNNRFQTDYTPRLRAFFNGGMCANSNFGPGYQAVAGLAFPLDGPDHLAISLQLGTNLGATGSTTRTFIISYRYYFTPVN